jgi:hypothetical protein
MLNIQKYKIFKYLNKNIKHWIDKYKRIKLNTNKYLY